MNFDLGVWESNGPTSAAEASRTYASFCRGETPPRVVQNSRAVEAFYDDLLTKWTETTSRDISPWAAPPHYSPSHVLMFCNWSKAEAVFPFIAALASAHGLILFDPQSEEVYLPEAEDE